MKTQKRPVGIITERDILRRIVHESTDPKEVKVSEIMSKPLVVGNINMGLVEGVMLMLKHKLKKLPVVKGRKLVGLITLTDVVMVDRVDMMVGKMVKKLREKGWLPPKRMNKIIGLYIA